MDERRLEAMNALLTLLCVFIALQHVAFLVLEMFLWKRPAGMKVFRTTPEFAKQSAALAANQGLYNGFLAAGLLWGAFHPALLPRVRRGRRGLRGGHRVAADLLGAGISGVDRAGRGVDALSIHTWLAYIRKSRILRP
jgi:hypothetical protein